MMHANYPGFLSHSNEHQRFTEKVEEFLQAYKKNDADLGLNMVVLLKEWVHDHTTKMDMRYAQHLHRNTEKFKQPHK